MKTPVTVISRFSGIVTYQDDTFQQFAGHLDEDGNLSVNYAQEGKDAIYQVQTDQNWLEEMLAKLGGNVTLTPANPGVSKVVTGLVAELSGRVAYDDGTSGDFIVQYNTQLGAIIPIGGDPEHWIAALANDETLASLTTMFAAVAGTAELELSPSAASPSPSISALSPSVSRFSPSISARSPSISTFSPSPSISRFSPSISTFSPSVSRFSPSPSPSAISPSISRFSPSISKSPSPSPSRRSPSISPSPSIASPSASISKASPSVSPSPSLPAGDG